MWLTVACDAPAPEQDQQSATKPQTTQQPESAEQDASENGPTLTEENSRAFLLDYARDNPADEATIHTTFGDIRIKLYQNTPLHRANFVYLTRQSYFDDTWFYRVSPGHVIQAGNTDEQSTKDMRKAIGEYKVPNEIRPRNFHKRGAVSAARTYYQNPEKKSDPYEFFIVLGKSYSRRELELLAEKHEMSFSEEQLDFYSKHAGAPHLDGEHTVFGEVIEGMDVVEKINQVETDPGEWPLENIPIEVVIED